MMRGGMIHSWGGRALGLILGAVFFWSGFLKVQAPLAFADSIASFQILPLPLINLLAMGLPPLEILLGILLMTGWKRREAAFGVLTLTAVFLLALGQARLRGLEVNCGCFGEGASSPWKIWTAIGRDLFLGGAAWVVFWGSPSVPPLLWKKK